MTVDGCAVVREVFGGFGGFLGLDVSTLVGGSVFDLLAPAAAAELARYFIESAGESLGTVSLPLPFRVDLIGGDGRSYPVDVIATGRDEGEETWSWVATLVPAPLQATISRPLDAVMERQPRDRVMALLAAELAVENAEYSTRGFLIDLSAEPGPVVLTSHDADQDVCEAIADHVTRGWRPWHGVADAETIALDAEGLPSAVRALAAVRGWRRVSTTPVWLDGKIVAAYLVLAHVPAGYAVHEIKAIVAARYRYLARVTSLLMSAWRDRDRLEWEATHDALTGLANRHAFDAALSASQWTGLLFIDVDAFKSVNDAFGHCVGDDVLAEVARRIQSVCGERDLACRIGGDEFAVLVSGTDAARTDALAEAVETAMEAPWHIANGPAGMAVSIGVVTDVRPGDALGRGSHAMRGEKRRRRAARDQPVVVG